MVRAVGISIVACGILMSAMAQDQIALSGTVTKGSGDGEGEPIEGAAISLKNQAATTTTNAAGEFSLTGPVAVRNPAPFAISVNSGVRFGLKGNQIQFSIASGVTKGSLSIYSGNGRLNSVRQIGALSAGTHRQSLPELAPGLYIVKLTLDNTTTSRKLVNTGSRMYLSESAANTARFAGSYASGNAAIDTIVVSKLGYSTVKHPISSYTATGISIEMDEDIVTCTPPDLPEPSGLTAVNEKLPDPFTFYDGTKLTKKSQWECRRQEILLMAQKYIYGPCPPKPDSVWGTVSGGTVNINCKEGSNTASFSATISGSGDIICLSMGGSGIFPDGSTKSLSVGSGNVSKIQNLYGVSGMVDNLATAWMVDRVMDVLELNPGSGHDPTKIMVSGCSGCGKAAFLVGAFSRIPLTVIVESGGGGAANLRQTEWFRHGAGGSSYSCQDQGRTTYPQGIDNLENSGACTPWVSPVADWIRSNSSKVKNLPFDQHLLLACIAPRACFHATNTHGVNEWCHLGGTGEALSAWAAEPVWNALGVPDNFGFNMPTSAYSHCTEAKARHGTIADEFYDRVFNGNTSANTDVMNIPDGKVQQPVSEWKDMWIDWDMDVTLE